MQIPPKRGRVDAPGKRPYPGIAKLQAHIARLLEDATGGPMFWVRGEVTSISEKNGSLYCQLVEMRAAKVIAKVSCFIYSSEVSLIRAKIRSAGLGQLIANGNEIALKIKVEYHHQYGLRVRGYDIDLDASVGALERRRKEILRRLRDERLMGRNPSLPSGTLPFRIGLIASADTAGWSDFVQTIRRSSYGIRILHADARVQGDRTESSVLDAFDCLERLAPDVIVLIRGGGSQIDLSHLDNEAIARRVAHCRIPVWIGIGHETDRSVLESVAGQSFKTPTAVAEAIVAGFVAASNRLTAAATRLPSVFDARVRPEMRRVGKLRNGFADAARRGMKSRQERLQQSREQLCRQTIATTRSSRQRLQHVRERLGKSAAVRLVHEGDCLAERRKSLFKTTARLQARSTQELRHVRKRLTMTAARQRIPRERDRMAAARKVLLSAPEKTVARSRLRLDRAGGGVRTALTIITRHQWILAEKRRALTTASHRSLERRSERVRALATDFLREGGRRALSARRDFLELRTLLAARRATVIARLGTEHHRVETWRMAIAASDPTRNLERGYALVYDQDGVLIRHIDRLRPGQRLTTAILGGRFVSRVDEVETEE